MKITNTAHASYGVSDLKKTVDFYCGCLGLKRKFSLTFGDFQQSIRNRYESEEAIPEAQKAFIASMEEKKDEIWLTYIEVAPHQYLEFFPREAEWVGGNSSKRNGYVHLALEVDDIHAARQELVEKGVECTEANFGIENTWQFWIKDPDGNEIELMQYTTESFQLTGNELV